MPDGIPHLEFRITKEHYMYRKSVLLALAALLSTIVPAEAEDHSRPVGDSNVIASVPGPGYPEGIAVGKKNFYVAGPATFLPVGYATIWVYNLATGALVDTIVTTGFGGSCIALDEHENIYFLVESTGQATLGVLKIDPKTHAQSVYSTGFNAVYTSAFNPPGSILLNDLAFDKNGNLYVTDTFQATIWRVPPGGGAPHVWFQNAQLDGPFGPNGIRMNEDGEQIYFTTTIDAMGAGHVWTLPVKDSPVATDLKMIKTYPPTATGIQAPDGIAFGHSGKLYVSLAVSSQISVLSSQGVEVARYSGPAKSNAGTTAWANPANIAFNGKTGSLLVTNHASLVPFDPNLFVVFDVYVNDTAGKLLH